MKTTTRKLLVIIYFIGCEYLFFLMLSPNFQRIYQPETRMLGLTNLIGGMILSSFITYTASRQVYSDLNKRFEILNKKK